MCLSHRLFKLSHVRELGLQLLECCGSILTMEYLFQGCGARIGSDLWALNRVTHGATLSEACNQGCIGDIVFLRDLQGCFAVVGFSSTQIRYVEVAAR